MPGVPRALLALTVLLAACGCSGRREGREYMPLAVGNRWDYRVITRDGRRVRRRLEITGRASARAFKASDGGDPAVLSWEDGFLSFQHAGRRVYMLMLPAVAGSSWWTVTPEGARVWCRVQGSGNVTVPAGTFRCVEVLMEPSGGRTEIRHWFARGVGWVRYSYGPRGGSPWMVRELTACEVRPAGPK
jgi:hypothetical protein